MSFCVVTGVPSMLACTHPSNSPRAKKRGTVTGRLVIAVLEVFVIVTLLAGVAVAQLMARIEMKMIRVTMCTPSKWRGVRRCSKHTSRHCLY